MGFRDSVQVAWAAMVEAKEGFVDAAVGPGTVGSSLWHLLAQAALWSDLLTLERKH